MKQSFFLFILFFFFKFAIAQKWNVGDIPDYLLHNASSVIRNEVIHIDIEKIGKLKITHEKTVTILNEQAAQETELMIAKDNYSKIKKVRGELFDESGNSIKKILKEDVINVSTDFDDNSITDGRLVAAELHTGNYPCTATFNYVELKNGYVNYLTESLIDINQSLQNFEIVLTEPVEMRSRYEVLNCQGFLYSEKIEKNLRIKTWHFSDIKAIKKNQLLPTPWFCIPVIVLVPEQFEIDNKLGSLKTWNDFGKWIYELNNPMSNLHENEKKEIEKLVIDCKTEQQKLNKLYSFLQNNCRYMNISLGIGSLKSADANETHTKKFGDCKGLSVYMQAMLKCVGIKSKLAVVFGGENFPPTVDSFPFFAFNHAILAAFINNDTVWLDCTSKKLLPGKLGEFTSDRNALLIDENGGHLTKTPILRPADNSIIASTKINIDKYFSILSVQKVTGDYSGMYLFLNKSGFENRVNDALQQLFEAKTIINKNIQINEPAENYDTLPIRISLTSDAKNYFSDERIFIKPFFIKNELLNSNIMNIDRKLPLHFYHVFQNIDSVEIKIPEGYKLDNELSSFKIKNIFFQAERELVRSRNENSVLIVSKFILFRNDIKTEEENDFISSIRTFNSNSNKLIVLGK